MGVGEWLTIVGIILGIIGAMLSGLVSLVLYFFKKKLESIDQQVANVQADVKSHVQNEEEVFWGKIERRDTEHHEFVAEVLQRMSAIEARLPNGELKALVVSVGALNSAVAVLQTEVAGVKKHLDKERV